MSIRLAAALPLLLVAAPALAADAGGAPLLDLRYRYEHVAQDGIARDADADAHSARLRLGYRTARWHGWSALGEVDGVAHLGGERFNDTRNGRTRYPTVADPDYVELNQALLRYDGGHGNVQLGRQRINLGNQRFVGGVGWRQNEQTYDGAMMELAPAARWKLTYAYVTNINTVFGPDQPPVPSLTAPANIHGDSHLLQARFTPGTQLAFTGYHYRLDLENVAVAAGAPRGTLSADTTGLRVQGSHGAFGYVLEHARQVDGHGNPWSLDSRYWLGEASHAAGEVKSTLGYEVLGAGAGGPGNRAFQTPLATKHAFQGWADQFLTTPADGLRDAYAGVVVPLAGGKAQAWYHDFRSDRGSYRYGHELNLSWERAVPQLKGLSVLLKAARYRSADAVRTRDADKLWVQLQYTRS
ncbi:alginate export family protein [Stenotrophomonas acidaminiphila]|uniref:alginate export family protein n=1 Tax=Stenotrophomonas acidaminiphila TaxID=128780 RepID=UPI0028AF6A59|nr:alginate export family protein [Stenotrophomonas acidaminiphila]